MASSTAMLLRVFSIISLFFTSVLANTEKTIFLGPEPITIPLTHPTLSDLRLHTLTPTPANGTLRTQLPAQFPSPEHPEGTVTWLLLDNLTPHQRYEVRVCWAATQPTAFTLTTFPLSTVWDTPSLITSLHAYTTSRQQQQQQPPTPDANNDSPPPKGEREEASLLLLRIAAAADYFTTNASLMRDVPPVDVDIILDPFLFNAVPRSIVGTAGFIVAVAVVAFFVARWVTARIRGLVVVTGGGGGGGGGREGVVKKRQ
ncbi:hypothetical protein F5144DRAFT_632443 [Chaetomium tenue]|uniref:Uncharacterized protein n=1 Tax=Chaetomium tenue TaxID=1854479 RepID=A0ACB7NZK1_9PEZI|nr:hypothetical protein F5144DRAFT_632443 [Chaetomium globosum]